MKNISFKIFIEKKGLVITTEMVVFSGLLSSLTFIIIANKYYHDYFVSSKLDKLMTSVFILFSALLPIMYFMSFGRTQKLRGQFEGILVLNSNEIIANDISYPLDEIISIEFQANDFKDKFESSTKSLNPRVSQGVNNLCSIQLSSGRKIEIKFLQEFEGKLRHNEELIVHYFKENKITFLKMTEILGLSTYAEIQAFKVKHNH